MNDSKNSVNQSLLDAFAEFFKSEELPITSRPIHPRVAAAGATAKAVLASPLLRATLKSFGIGVNDFTPFTNCTSLMKKPDWNIAIVLVPCKPEAYKLTSNHLTPTATQTQVVDTILKIENTFYGLNINAYAIQLAVQQLFGDKRPFSILVAGTGAVARSAVSGLSHLYPESFISVIGRTTEKAQTVVEICGVGKVIESIQEDKYDLVVNATSVGHATTDERLAYPLEDTFKPGAHFFDVIIGSTHLQQSALNQGCIVISGAAMQYQGIRLRGLLINGTKKKYYKVFLLLHIVQW